MGLLKIGSCVLIAASLAGCAMLSTKRMETGLNGLVGQPLQAAIDKLGFPDQESTIAGNKVYTWGVHSGGIAPKTTTTNLTGTIGTKPVRAMASTTSLESVSYECTVRLVLGEDQKIATWDFEGDLGGCSYFNKLFAPKKGSRASR